MGNKLYNVDGYIDFDYVMSDTNPFKFLVGGRGSGKTYGAIQYTLNSGKKFMFMRRTQTQIDMIKNQAFSPFTPIDENIYVKSITKSISGIYRGEAEGPAGAPIGYMCALSTISNFRGFDASDVEIIIFDEFIGEAHERQIKNEGQAFLNAYETINRNRELQGLEPTQVLALANSNMLANPIFIELNLVTPVERMIPTGQSIYRNPQRGVSVYMIQKSPILEKKRKTALYSLTGDTEFSQMALDNKFTKEEMDHIAPQDLKQYKLFVTVGELAIYKHKSLQIYYVTGHKSGSTVNEYQAGQMDLKRFRRDFYYIWIAYLKGKILFESYIFKVLFEKYYNM